uniref:RCC1 domain-containing protein 1 n=1 Tax=Anopheles christyi TaxID=43041 RepID=A0A182KGH5_9DIPT
MSYTLWIKGLNPMEALSHSDWKAIDLSQLLHLSKGSSAVQIRFGPLYSFIVHEKTLYIFCILTEKRKTISFEAEIVSLAANSKHCLVLLATGELRKYDPVEERSIGIHFLGIENDSTKATKESIIHLACGEYATVACTSTNAVYNIPNLTTTLPRHVRIRKVVTGFEHCLMLSTNGDVYSWGGGLRGQLGNGEIVASSDLPCIVQGLEGVKVIDIAAEGWHSAAVSAFGDLYTWGWNNQGQLGLHDPQHRERVVSLPQLVSFPDDEDLTVEKVHCGIGHTAVEAVDVDRKKHAWVAGWDLEKRFNYFQATSSANFEGFRKLVGPFHEAAERLELGTGAYQVYFLQRDQNE